MGEIARQAAYGRAIEKTIEAVAPGGTVAIMKAVDNRPMLAVDKVYPETPLNSAEAA
jgi:hypothetical protein